MSDVRPGQPGLRNTPQQDRSRATVEHILNTAADLLTEVGVDGFNTNLLAKRSEVRVRTIYRYFPNKLAILSELARRMALTWDTWFDDTTLSNPNLDIRTVWTHYIEAFVLGVSAVRGGHAIRTALHSLPELRDIEVEDTRRLRERLAKGLCKRDPTLAPELAIVASSLLLETAISTLDTAFTGPEQDSSALLNELVDMQVAYLERLLNRAGP